MLVAGCGFLCWRDVEALELKWHSPCMLISPLSRLPGAEPVPKAEWQGVGRSCNNFLALLNFCRYGSPCNGDVINFTSCKSEGFRSCAPPACNSA